MPDVAHGERRARRRRGPSLVLVLVLGGLGVSCSSQAGDSDAVNRTGSPPDPVSESGPPDGAGQRTGPLADGGLASCVEGYTPRTAATRSFAFDGTVTDIGAGHTDRPQAQELGYVAVTFVVDEWFRGALAAR